MTTTSIQDRAWKYISAMPPSIQGADGSTTIFNVARTLTKGFSLPPPEAFALLARWNETKAFPPWSDSDLRHKLEDAAKASAPEGYLLKDDDRQHQRRSAPRVYPDAAAIARASQEKVLAEEGLEKAKRRLLWPTFTRPADSDLEAIAKLRRLPIGGVHLARVAGFLWMAQVDGVECLVVREGKHFAQAMRLDGRPFDLPGAPKKKTLPGSLSRGFLGWSKMGGPGCPILIVEGVAGLLEGIAAVWATDSPAGVLAAISSGSRFANETFPMPDLTGRRFRIVPDHDDGHTGFKSAAAWLAELEDRGATVDAFGLPPGCKDLGPVVADHGTHADYLNQLLAA